MSKKNNLNYVPASAKTAAQKQEEAKNLKKHGSTADLSPEARAKLIKKRAWTLSVVSLSLILVLTLSIIFATYQPTLYSEQKNKAPTETSVDSLISNDEFGLSTLLYNGLHSSALQFPYLPESWAINNKSINDSVVGVISRDEKDKQKVLSGLNGVGITEGETLIAVDPSEGLTENSDKNVLLMYNKTATNMRAYSNSFAVPTNGYLKITVKIKTNIVSGDGAYIALKTTSSDSAESELQFTRVNTNGAWTNYTFYVEGSKTSSKTLYLFVGLGTYDNPVKGFAEVDFTKAEKTKKVNFIENNEKSAEDKLAQNLQTKSYVQDSSEDNLIGTPIFPAIAMQNSNGNTVTPVDNATLGEIPFSGTPVIYGVSNDNGSGKKSDFIKMSNKLIVQQSSATPYYRMSFWAKTKDIPNNTGAYFYVNLFDKNGNPIQSLTKSFNVVKTSTDADDVNSGWKEFSFLFQPDNTQYYSAEFVFSLGALKRTAGGDYAPAQSDLATTGSLFVTEFELKEIYQSEYIAASEGDSIVKVSVTETTSTGLITNGNFDSPVSNAFTGNIGANPPSGYDPNGWNVVFPNAKNSTGNTVYTPHAQSDILFGIVPNNASNDKKQEYLGANYNNFFGHTGSDNLLAVNIKNATSIGFVSNKFTLNANTTYLISFIVKTENATNVNAYLSGDLEETFAINNISADNYYTVKEFLTNGYTKYNFIIKTGDKAKSVALELWVGDKNVKYSNNTWDTTKLAQTGSIVAFDEAKTQTLTDEEFKTIVTDKVNDTNVFEKQETKKPVVDEDGNETEEEEIADVTYTTTKQNVMVKDFSYKDKSKAIENPEQDTTTPDPVAPINWLLLSSLILSIAVIIFLVTVIVKKFRHIK